MKYVSSFEPIVIYVMRINDSTHKGCLKIGKASLDYNGTASIFELPQSILNQAAKKRINGYTQTAGIAYDLLHTELAVYITGKKIVAFWDHDVHEVLERSGIKKKVFNTEAKADEWYITDLETVKKAIAAVKQGRKSLNASEITQGLSPIIFRPEQQEAILKAKTKFKKSNQMLWNAKMRFGKTISSLQVVKDMNFVRTLILTHRPVVNEGWFGDFNKIFYDRPDFFYGSRNKGNTFKFVENQAHKGCGHYVYFASLQDLRGSELVGGKFDKNNEIFNVNWDLIIIDEAHEGTQTELGMNVLKELEKNNTKILQLSGTPFNLFDKYNGDDIYTWDYVMEQKAKRDWDILHKGDPNPYASLPHMNIFTFDLGKMLVKYQDDELAFNFHEFFRVDDNDSFIHKQDIKSFLDLICKADENSNYPYSTKEYRDNFRHSLWMIPGVKAARALSSMLQQHPVFSQFQIVNVAGDGDEDVKSEDALKMVQKAIGENPDETYTITLSCGRLTTGVSVPAWTAVFMLAGSFNTSAASYMQTIFRVQTPATINGRMKTECFVFDFAPDRTLKVIAETAKVSARGGNTGGDGHQIMGEFLNFCPVISVSGTQMRPYSTDEMLEQLKKVYVERVVRNGFEDNYLYNNDLLMKLDGINLAEFDKLKKLIGSTKSMPKSGDIDLNNQGFTNEEYELLEDIEKKKRKKEELTPEEIKLLEEKKEKKKNRDNAISILRGISIRMPLMIYGAELADEEVITLENFSSLIDDQSWKEFMPQKVTKQIFNNFKKYYDPDIFRAAGKRIRAIAKAADDEDIEERIKLITSIFNCFRNPDKETVLTPWRVVNMHLSECLGGYSFWNEDFTETIPEPRWVNQGEVTSEVFSPNSQILEINSKSGLYPLYITYSIFRARCKQYSKEELTYSFRQKLWNITLQNNIFIICKTPMAKQITQRTLVGYSKQKLNAHYFEDLVNQMKNKQQQLIDKILGRNYWEKNGEGKMKFNAIVGNPPYQENISNSDNSSLSKQLFPSFIMTAITINPQYVSLITPSRWFTGDAQDKSFIKLRDFLRKNNHMQKIFCFKDEKDVFNGVEIKGGINYFLYNSSYTGKVEFIAYENGRKITNKRNLFEEGFDVIIFDSEALPILSKVMGKNFIPLASITAGRNPFGIVGKESTLQKITFDKMKEGLSPIRCKGNVIKYIDPKNIKKNVELLNSYKVFISKSAGNPNSDKKVIGIPYIGEKGSLCTDSLVTVGGFDTLSEAENLCSYMKTKFLRYLVSVLKSSQNVYQNVYQFVPMQNFTSDSDIDWSKNVAEIDQQLYKKYKLSEDEIAFIEEKVKPME